LKFIGHLDLQHLFIRAARRANIFVAHTEGFNPSPRLSLALSLALYYEGLGELAEIELSEQISAEDFVRRMNAQLPPEVQLLSARAVEKSQVALAQRVGRATYKAVLASKHVDAQRVKEQVSRIAAAERLEVEMAPSAKSQRRSGRKKQAPKNQSPPANTVRDLKAGIHSIRFVDASPAPAIEMELAHGPRLHVKPSDVLKLVDADAEWRITRVELATDSGLPLFDNC
jgi:radical SAM-linked protein